MLLRVRTDVTIPAAIVLRLVGLVVLFIDVLYIASVRDFSCTCHLGTALPISVLLVLTAL
jgi:hypothetical protein